MSRMTWTLVLFAAPLLGLPQVRARSPALDEQIAESIRALGDDSFEVRESAQLALLHIGAPALPALRQALDSPDPEVVRRAANTFEEIHFAGFRPLQGVW